MVKVSTSHAVGRGFASRPGYTKDHHRNGANCLPTWYAGIMVEEFYSEARPGSVWNGR